MSDTRDFGFCPRCGALMQDGVCQSCGCGKPIQPYVQVRQQKKKTSKAVVAICVTAGVLLLLGLIAAIIFFFDSMIKSVGRVSDGYYGGDYYGEDYYDYDEDYYVPDEDDPYYKEVTDATRTDLSYSLFWAVDSVNPDDSEDYCAYYAAYPVVEGEDMERLASVNEAVRDLVLEYKDSYRDYEGGCSSYGYVTYMDEEKMSVAVRHSLYGEEGTVPLIHALTFRMDTGKMMETSELLVLDQELVLRFRAQDKTQNGGVEFVENLSDDELLNYLANPESCVLFYTPVGLEVGFNYDGGWVTVTLKDYAL